MKNMTDNQSLISSLFQINAIQFGEFKLKSGLISPIYINLRKIISYPTLLRSIAQTMWEKTNRCDYELICGVPYTALPIATCMSLDHNIPMVIRRKEKKDYGTKQMVEGDFKQGQSCLIVEDLITTGSSIIETAAELEGVGIQVKDLVVLIDREQGGKSNLEKKYKVHAVLTLSEILQQLLNTSLPNLTERSIIEKLLLERSA